MSRIAIATEHPPTGVAANDPMRLVGGRSVGGLKLRGVTSTMEHFTKAGIHSCKNVNNLGAISIHGLKTTRATIDCSKMIIDGDRTKRVSVKHFSLSGMSSLSLTVKRSRGLLRPTHLCTSTKMLDVRARGPIFRGNGSSLSRVRVQKKTFNCVTPSVHE